MYLVWEGLSIDRSTSASSAGRITCLNHKVGDDAMEFDAVVVAAASQLGEVAACVWRMLPVQLDDNRTHTFVVVVRMIIVCFNARHNTKK